MGIPRLRRWMRANGCQKLDMGVARELAAQRRLPAHGTIARAFRRRRTMNKMKYRGCTARIEFDEVNRIFVGHLAGIKDIVGFHGTTVDELENAFRGSVDHYITISEQQGRPAQKLYSGRLMLRVSPEVHAAVATAAGTRGQSINQWASEVLEKAASQT